MIILDFGSATTCKNDQQYVKRMIDELKEVDTGKHRIVIKWQLFLNIPPVPPLSWAAFDYAYHHAKKRGYETTASVFDLPSLKYLLGYEIPFVKIANRPERRWLIGEIPRRVPVYASFSSVQNDFYEWEPSWRIDQPMWCVSKYPAVVADYDKMFVDSRTPILMAYSAISDHTTDFELYYKYEPEIIEWHYKLKDSTGPDAGPFARTPEQLAGVL